MPNVPHLAKLNLIPAGLKTGKASAKIKVHSAVEWEDKYSIWTAYPHCDLERLYRLEVNGRWFWPRPEDNRYPFLSADELMAHIANLSAKEMGIAVARAVPPRPEGAPENGAWIEYGLNTPQGAIRTRSRIMGEPFLENGVWWMKIMGERMPVPCNAIPLKAYRNNQD